MALATRQRFDVVFCGHLNAVPLAATIAAAPARAAVGAGARHRGLAAARFPPSARPCHCGAGHVGQPLHPQQAAGLGRRARRIGCACCPTRSPPATRRADRRDDLVARHGLAGRRIILTVGRLSAAERYKGHDRLIAALPGILARVPDAAYLIVGSGDDRPRLERLAREAGVADRVVFAGHVPDEELPDYFALAHVFAMPSTGEGFGIVFLEAAASGLPVIGGNRDGSVDALAEGRIGRLVDPESREEIEAAVVEALERRQPARRCRGAALLASRSLQPMSMSSSALLPADGAKPAERAGPAPAVAHADRDSERVLVLEPGRAERHYWRDLWHYRELFAILAWRDVAVRYKQTVIGVAWAVVRPLLTMVVFTIVFGKLADLPSDGDVPYPVLVFAGMLPWFLFASILGEASNSLVGNANLIGKVYFPRLIIPASAAVVALVDFAINLAILVRHHGLVRVRARLADRAAARSSSRSPCWRASAPRSSSPRSTSSTATSATSSRSSSSSGSTSRPSASRAPWCRRHGASGTASTRWSA